MDTIKVLTILVLQVIVYCRSGDDFKFESTMLVRSSWDTSGAFIVYCNAAAVPMYRLLIYRRSTQRKVKINLTLLQYRIAVVGAETAFRALQPQRS